jgi:hypothetical protein
LRQAIFGGREMAAAFGVLVGAARIKCELEFQMQIIELLLGRSPGHIGAAADQTHQVAGNRRSRSQGRLVADRLQVLGFIRIHEQLRLA